MFSLYTMKKLFANAIYRVIIIVNDDINTHWFIKGSFMAQHFLLSAEARSLSPIAIARMSEHEAVKVMKSFVGVRVSLLFVHAVLSVMKPILLRPVINGSVRTVITAFQ